MLDKFGITVLLSFLVIVLWLLRSPEDFQYRILREYLNDGHFELPTGQLTKGPYPYAYRWQGNDLPKIRTIQDYMELRCLSDFCTGPEFGVGLQVGYLRQMRIHLLNPDIVDQSPVIMECNDSRGADEIYDHYAPRWIRVSTIVGDKRQEIVLENKLACVVHLFIHKM
jgi:hypothetical protein